MNQSKADEAKAFDRAWHSSFEELGKMDVPLYLKASWPKKHFQIRHLFIKHLMRELSRESVSPLFISHKPAISCLDVGCNSGFYTDMLKKTEFSVIGLDYSHSLLLEAKAAYPGISFHRANAYDMPFEDNTFDCVVSFGLIQCVADWRKVLREMIRVMKPSGVGLVETNRAYPRIEQLIRNAVWILRHKVSFRQALTMLKPYSPSLPDWREPRRYSIPEITGDLYRMGALHIVIHDPAWLWVFHNFFWAVSFFKGPLNGRGGPSKPEFCPSCSMSLAWRNG